MNHGIKMSPGAYAVFGGESEARVQSWHDLIAYGTMPSIGTTLLLFLALKSRRRVLPVMTDLPFTSMGGVLSIMVAGGNLLLGSMMGFVTLSGISLRNSTMLISHYEHLVHVNGFPRGMNTTAYGVSGRLVPILMTVLVTALALLPLTVMSGAAGDEIEGPMAVMILGGLVTSTAFSLVVLPTPALHYGRFERNIFAEPDRAAGGTVAGGES